MISARHERKLIHSGSFAEFATTKHAVIVSAYGDDKGMPEYAAYLGVYIDGVRTQTVKVLSGEHDLLT